MLHALRTSISRSDLSHHPGLGSNHRTLLDILAILVCIALKYRSNQRNKQNPLFFCVSVSLRYSEPVTNHTGRINLQVQSSYKSKISQKYASLLYIANVYLYLFCFSRASKTYVTEHNHTSPLSTVDVFITELRNRLENRSCVTFFFCPFFLFCNTTPHVLVFLVAFISRFFDPPFALFYNEMVTVGKYRDRKSGTIANLREYGTTDGVLILSMRLVVCWPLCCLIFFLLFFFFRYIFQTGFI